MPATVRDVPPENFPIPALEVLREFSERTGFQQVPGFRDDEHAQRIVLGTNADRKK